MAGGSERGMGYSFRFYGRAPAHWHEGAALGYGYELQFARKLSAADKARVAECYERMLQSGAAEPSPEPWLWSDDRFALLFVGERFSSAGRMVFSKVTDFLMQAKRICPLRDVVFLNVAEVGDSRWDAWTLQTQQQPDAGPRYAFELDARVVKHRRAVDSSLPAADEDEGFEAARAQARKDIVLEKAAAESKDGGFGLMPVDELPAAEQWPDELRNRFRIPAEGSREGDYVMPVAARPYALMQNARGESRGVAFLDDDGQRQEVQLPEPGLVGAIAIHPDGSRAIFALYHALLEVDFATGVATERWQPPMDDRKIHGVAYASSGQLWAVKTDKAVLVLNPRAGGADANGEQTATVSEVARARCKGTKLESLRDGTLLFASDFGAKPRIFGFAEGKLKLLASYKMKLWAAERSGAIYLWSSEHFRLTNVDETYEAFAAPLRMKAEAARKKAEAARLRALSGKPARKKPPRKKAAKRGPKPQLAITWGQVSFPPPARDARFGEADRMVTGSVEGERAAALVYFDNADKSTKGYEKLRWLDDTGKELFLDVAEPWFGCFDSSGSVVYMVSHKSLLAARRDGSKAAELFPMPKGETGKQVLCIGTQLLLLTNKKLYLLAEGEGEVAIVHKIGVANGHRLCHIPGHDAVAVSRDYKGLDVIALVNSKLKRLAKIDESLSEVAYADGQLLVWDKWGKRSGCVESLESVLALLD